jgi:hypothetical protein
MTIENHQLNTISPLSNKMKKSPNTSKSVSINFNHSKKEEKRKTKEKQNTTTTTTTTTPKTHTTTTTTTTTTSLIFDLQTTWKILRRWLPLKKWRGRKMKGKKNWKER